MRYPVIMTLIGNAGLVVVCLLLGPAPFLNIESSIVLLQGMFALSGMLSSLVMISTMRRAICASSNLGYGQNVGNMFMLSGIFKIYSQNTRLSFFIFLRLCALNFYNFDFRRVQYYVLLGKFYRPYSVRICC